MTLNEEKTRKIVKDKLADPLGMDVTKAAHGIRMVVDENMANASRVYAVEKGLDYKAFTMIAFGGQGPNHAFSLAKLLEIKEIIIPLGAGVASAFGLLVSPVAFDLVKSYVSPLQKINIDHLNTIFEGMEREGTELLTSAGVPEDEIRFVRTCDMRYVGQGHEISVPLPSGEFTKSNIDGIYATFDREYERIFHRLNPGVDIEGLNWRVFAVGPKPITEVERKPSSKIAHSRDALKGRRRAYSPDHGDFIDYDVYDRYRLLSGMSIKGPAIVEETESTSIIGSGDRADVDEFSNLVVTLEI
jgi:N-methylhydantoinase A